MSLVSSTSPQRGLWASGLGPNCTQESLRGFFSQFGALRSVCLRPRNHALVNFLAPEDAQRALAASPVLIDGARVTLEYELPPTRPNHPGGGNNAAPNANPKKAHNQAHFQPQQQRNQAHQQQPHQHQQQQSHNNNILQQQQQQFQQLYSSTNSNSNPPFVPGSMPPPPTFSQPMFQTPTNYQASSWPRPDQFQGAPGNFSPMFQQNDLSRGTPTNVYPSQSLEPTSSFQNQMQPQPPTSQVQSQTPLVGVNDQQQQQKQVANANLTEIGISSPNTQVQMQPQIPTQSTSCASESPQTLGSQPCIQGQTPASQFSPTQPAQENAVTSQNRSASFQPAPQPNLYFPPSQGNPQLFSQAAQYSAFPTTPQYPNMYQIQRPLRLLHPIVLWNIPPGLVNAAFGSDKPEGNRSNLDKFKTNLMNAARGITQQPISDLECVIFLRSLNTLARETLRSASWVKPVCFSNSKEESVVFFDEVIRIIRSYYEHSILPTALIIISVPDCGSLLDWTSSVSLPCLLVNENPSPCKVGRFINIKRMTLSKLMGVNQQQLAQLSKITKKGKPVEPRKQKAAHHPKSHKKPQTKTVNPQNAASKSETADGATGSPVSTNPTPTKLSKKERKKLAANLRALKQKAPKKEPPKPKKPAEPKLPTKKSHPAKQPRLPSASQPPIVAAVDTPKAEPSQPVSKPDPQAGLKLPQPESSTQPELNPPQPALSATTIPQNTVPPAQNPVPTPEPEPAEPEPEKAEASSSSDTESEIAFVEEEEDTDPEPGSDTDTDSCENSSSTSTEDEGPETPTPILEFSEFPCASTNDS
ncbi:hypothetical protein Pelo_13101 [Pelomyxa schiedti]|nr:hypothetical protein Pelo_13101 [Pelomyxa schiedti]